MYLINNHRVCISLHLEIMEEMIFRCFLFSVKCHNILPGKGESDSYFVSNSCFGKDVVVMHKPRRKTNYYEQFYYEYEGVTYSGKKKYCEELGINYSTVLTYKREKNCSFEEAIAHYLSLKKKKTFVFRNRKWLSLDKCCAFYGVNKYSVLNYIYTYDYTIQESLEIMIKHAEKLKFQYKGKWYPSFQNCCEEMGIPACTVKKCMKETGRSKTVALNYCIKQAENRKNFNPSPFTYRNKEYPSFILCCKEYNLKAEQVRLKSLSQDISLQEALDFYLLQHPVKRKQEYDRYLSIAPITEQCRQYGIKRSDVYNYVRKHNCSNEEAIKFYIELNKKIGTGVIEFEGVKYVSLRECCKLLSLSYRLVYNRIINTNSTPQEALQYFKRKQEKLLLQAKAPIYLENGDCFENLEDLCTALQIRYRDVYGYAERQNCSITEAADYYIVKKKISQNVTIKIGDQIYDDLQICCKEQGISYKWVCKKIIQEQIPVTEAVEFYLEKKERKKRKAEQKMKPQNQTPSFQKNAWIQAKKVVVMGKEYKSLNSCYSDLGITKKLVLRRVKETNCSLEEAIVYVYQRKLQKQFIFRNETFRSFNACCMAYGIAQDSVATKSKREGITRQEALEKFLALREK